MSGKETTIPNHQGKGFTCTYNPAIFDKPRSPYKLSFKASCSIYVTH